MHDLDLALEYKPYIMFDKAEPFPVDGIGYRIFRKPEGSTSFRRFITFDQSKVAYCIEYAIYFDYDIQHMYDLEHIWIYVDHDGNVCDAEASFHGKYLKSVLQGKIRLQDSKHLMIYCQPGKHAFMPEGYLFQLIPNWYAACNENAGEDGLLIMDMFKDRIFADEKMQDLVKRYIKSQYSFHPTLEFEHRSLSDQIFRPWEELKDLIPVRIHRELERIIRIAK